MSPPATSSIQIAVDIVEMEMDERATDMPNQISDSTHIFQRCPVGRQVHVSDIQVHPHVGQAPTHDYIESVIDLQGDFRLRLGCFHAAMRLQVDLVQI